MSTISAGTTSNTALKQTGDTTGNLVLQTNTSTTALTLNTSGALGVGTSPSYGTAGQVLTSAGSAAAPTWSAAGGGSPGGTNTQVQYNNSGAFGGISGFTTDGTRVTASTTIGVGGATPSTSGAGITFPATQSASTNANTLDDYEEGTWTPSLKFGGGSTGMTYSSQTGYYVKTGKNVTVGFVITLTAKGSSTGAATVDGFTGFTPQTEGRGGGVGANTANMSASTVGIGFYFSGASTFELQKLTTAGSGTVAATNSDFTDSSSFRVTLSFICDA